MLGHEAVEKLGSPDTPRNAMTPTSPLHEHSDSFCLGTFVAQAYHYHLTVGSREPTHSRAAGSLNLLRSDLSLSTLLVPGLHAPLVLLHLETFRDTEPIPFVTATTDNSDESVHALKLQLQHTIRKPWTLFPCNLRARENYG